MIKRDGKALYYEEWLEWLKEQEQPSYRAKQIFSWIHQKNITDFSQASNIPSTLISKLNEEFYINCTKIQKKLVSAQDDTVKYLYMLEDGEEIETVFMSYNYGNSVCISSEVGCAMGCSFCASTKAGLIRRLTASEMLDQVYKTESDLGKPISHIVVMGIGEPLDNIDELVRFLRLISHKDGRNISLRHITVSTCGLVDKIYKLAEYKLPITLAISLHAPNDMLRSKTMPINKRYNIDELLNACRYYFKTTKRRITFEYACIEGFNDSIYNAKELANKLHGFACHVNLIPVNPIEEQNYTPSSERRIKEFSSVLDSAGIAVTIRRSLGRDIEAACGQLRRKSYKDKNNGKEAAF